MIERAIREYLSNQRVRTGETVQFGWFIFRVAEAGPPAKLESLDFNRMASFTTDLSEAESIYRKQQEVLKAHSAREEGCSLMQSAIVSKSYRPKHPSAFIKRDEGPQDHSSGWYVGIVDDPLSLEDQESFEVKSLYELSISDKRMLPYWLMPVGTVVALEKGVVT